MNSGTFAPSFTYSPRAIRNVSRARRRRRLSIAARLMSPFAALGTRVDRLSRVLGDSLVDWATAGQAPAASGGARRAG